MWGGNMMGWSGGVGNFGFMPILFCGVLISAAVVPVRPLLRGRRIPASRVEDRVLSFLGQRFAREEIGHD
jgi:hypothetical protein